MILSVMRKFHKIKTTSSTHISTHINTRKKNWNPAGHTLWCNHEIIFYYYPWAKTLHVIVSEVNAMTQLILFPYKGYMVSFSFVYSDWHHRGSNYASEYNSTRICHRRDLRPLSVLPAFGWRICYNYTFVLFWRNSCWLYVCKIFNNHTTSGQITQSRIKASAHWIMCMAKASSAPPKKPHLCTQCEYQAT